MMWPMTTYAALLRGINLGAHKKIAMGDLRAALESLGYGDVETYLQSGNAIFTTEKAEATVGREIETAVKSRFGHEVKVLVRAPDELAAVVAGNPFPEAATEPTRVHVAFLSATPDDKRMARIEPAAFAPDELHLGDRAIYLRYPNGAGRTKLTNDLLERRLGVTSTSRNWNTVSALLERVAGTEAPR